MTNLLARVLVDICIFLETADDSVLDPDAGLRTLETLAYRLRALSSADRHALASAMRAIADVEPAHRELVLHLPQSLGLEDESGD